MQDKHLGAIHLTNTQFLNIIFGQSGYGEVWYRAWFGSKRPRVRIPILRPNKKVHPPGGLSYLDGLRDSKGRHQSADWCKKVSGGHFFSPWENPLVSGRTPCGCGQKPILSVTTSLAEPPNIYYRCWVFSLFTYEIVSKFWNLTFIYDVTTVFP